MGLQFYSTFMQCARKDKHFSVRKSVVQEALERGIKPTARRFWYVQKYRQALDSQV
jgi:hypothetical protein